MHPIAKLGRVLLAGTAALALCGPATIGQGQSGLSFIQPAAAASVQIDFFYDRLAPHGSWIEHRRHGYVFVPAVGEGWRPYTRGHWVYTDDHGWYWDSEEPFAWAAYHYGRWGYDPDFGWYWVPGNVWAPAWVTWRHGGGHVGWAPIGPGDRDGYVYGTPDYYEPPVVEAWVFVPERRFVAVDIARYVTPVVEVNLFLGKARERHHVRYRDGRAYNPFLPRERVTEIVNEEVNIYNITVVDSPDEVRRRGGRDRDGDRDGRQIQAFRAEVSDTRPKERPERVVNSAEEIKSPPRLKQTAKGKRPDDAPPSVAELKKGDNVAKPGDGDREEAGRDGKRGQSESAERKQDAEKPDRAGRNQDNGRKNAKQDDGEQKAKQAERKEDASKDNGKPKAVARPEQNEREKAGPKHDAKKQAKPDREPRQKQRQATPDREPRQKQRQAKPDRAPQQKQKQNQAKPERQRKAPPQRESRNAPQGEPKAKQAKPNKKQQAQGGGEQKQERGGPDR